MRDPNNINQVEYNNNSYSILKLDNIPDFNIEDYDLLDSKEFNRYISDMERICRMSFEYREMVKYLRENMDMNKCSFYENVNNLDTFKIKIHLHHHPFTLYDLCIIIFNKRSYYREDLYIESVAKEVMFLHYNLYVGLIPLSETVHELVHNNYLFIPMDKVLGKYQEFKNLYGDFMTPEQTDVFEKNEEFTKSYHEDLSMNTVLKKSYVYLDLTGTYDLPTFEEVIDKMNVRIKNIKEGRSDVVEKPRLSKIIKKVDNIDNSLYFEYEQV